MDETTWARPRVVTDLEVCFGGSMDKLLPPMDDIPKEYKSDHHPMCELVNQWFFSGLSGAQFEPREGVETKAALLHLKAIMGSFEPQHEHKVAGCAYLLDQFFKKVDVPE